LISSDAWDSLKIHPDLMAEQIKESKIFFFIVTEKTVILFSRSCIDFYSKDVEKFMF
jgi:hypothetical protein